MRQIVCKFADERQFFRHLLRSTPRARQWDGLRFLAGFEAEAGERIRVTLYVANRGERYTLEMTVTGCRPSASQRAGVASPLYHLEATVYPDDNVWLEMFASKIATMARLQDARAMHAA